MDRLAYSLRAAGSAWQVIRVDRTLLLLACLSLLVGLGTLALSWAVAANAGLVAEVLGPNGWVRPMAVLLALVTYLVLAVVVVAFSAAIVAAATARVAGNRASLGSSLRAMFRHSGRLAAWGLTTATFSLALAFVRERGGVAGRMVPSLGAMPWALATSFVVPALVLQEDRVKESIGRSGNLVQKTWGQSVLGSGGMGLPFLLAAIPFGILSLLAASLHATRPGAAWALGAACIVAFLALAVLHSLFAGVHKAALYRYATTGDFPLGFPPTHVQGAFVPT